MRKFSAHGAGIRTLKTARGIDATVPLIYMGGLQVGTLYDEASAIVAKVEFTDPKYRKEFLAEAKAEGFNMGHGQDNHSISEYARCLGHEAEADYLQKQYDDRQYVKGMRYRYDFRIWGRPGGGIEGRKISIYTVEKLPGGKLALEQYVRQRGYKSARQIEVPDGPVLLTPPGPPKLAASKRTRRAAP